MLIDKKIDFNGYTPKNYNDSYQRSITLYDALVHSVNVPAVALLHEIGIDTGIGFLEKPGIPMHQDDRNLSIALGGFTEGGSPLEMAQAFSMFPNLGSMNQAHAITKITSGTANVLLEVAEEAVEVMKPENAYTMTQMLMGVVQGGTGRNAALDRPTAGKTGTTQLPSTEDFQGVKGANDAWFVGYTSELVTAVWVGYDKSDPKHVMESSGGSHPAKIFQTIMSKSLQNTVVSSFLEPKNSKDEGKKDEREKRQEVNENKPDKDNDDKPGKGNSKKK